MATREKQPMVSIERIQQCILVLRGQRIILAADLARMYGVPVKQLNQAVRRNAGRFPEDFVFQIRKEEADSVLRSQVVALNDLKNLKSQHVTSSWGGARRALPYAFTEHGVLMAANVLRSSSAVKASVFIVRAFVKLREMLSAHHQLADKLAELERKLQDHDGQILAIVDAIRQLMEDPEEPAKPPIGFHSEIASSPVAVSKKKRLRTADL